MTVALLATALVYSFITCCVVSAALQVLAWSRHAKEGAPITVRALWQPEGYFDEIGLQQIRLARRLLTVGGLAYLAYGALMLTTNVAAAG
ncbi:MAG: hypothetical protein WD766_11060 [Gemmatimonadota bacterium]